MMSVSRVFQICNAYESGFGHGLKKDELIRDYYSDAELNEAYKLGYKADEKQSDPETRLNEIFIEADQIIEAHPELVDSMNEEQFNKAKKLVENVEIEFNLPIRLRKLAEELYYCSEALIISAQQKTFRDFCKWSDRADKIFLLANDLYLREWTAELEEEENSK